jgi:Tfp pilus assembly protein PilZ
MNQRTEERKSINLPVKMHFFGEQVDVSTSEDISEGGFFVRTQSVRQLDKGVVALVTILINDNQEHHYLAEVVRITDSGAAFQVIHSVDQ